MKTQSTKASKSKSDKNVFLKWLKPILIGTIAFFICFILFIVIFSFLMMSKDFGDNLLFAFSCVTLTLSAFVSGYTAARISKIKGLLIGGGTGLICFFLVSILGAFLTQSGFGTIGFIKLLFCVLPAGFGGFLGVNRKKRRK